jgi:hypothetical protein
MTEYPSGCSSSRLITLGLGEERPLALGLAGLSGESAPAVRGVEELLPKSDMNGYRRGSGRFSGAPFPSGGKGRDVLSGASVKNG